MTEACQYLHDELSQLPRMRQVDPARIPRNGIYVLFESGEYAHGGDRIVRVGTHRGPNRLASRIREHLCKANKDRSIFRKHVGRCLLARERDAFLEQWEIDLTSRAARARFGGKIDEDRLRAVEAAVTEYMADNFSFAVLQFDDEADRLGYEEALLTTIHQCPECHPSESWLGRHHPKSSVIRDSGLWNVQGFAGRPLSLGEAKHAVALGCRR